MTPLQFVDKWRPVALTERAAAHSHFNDLCDLLDHPKPLDVDKTGDEFTFEKGVKKSGGGDGFADVWKKSHFAWEYKKRKRNLDDALGQLARYALALENPPLHIACDTESFRIVTAWTNTLPRAYDISLNDILDPAKLDNLHSAFFDPDKLRPNGTRADLTEKAAERFCALADSLRGRGYSPSQVAHFVNQLAFLFFAEDVKLLPNGYFRRVLREISERPRDSEVLLNDLFAILAKGGRFGLDRLPYVNGGLFDGQPALSIHENEVPLLVAAGSQSWAHIDPSIFGTLFERFLDPDKRSQIGAHYTDTVKIMNILKPVVLDPLEALWSSTKSAIADKTLKARLKGFKAKEWKEAEELRSIFLEKLKNVRVLDPACGSGNFLYMALQAIKDLEHKANQECEVFGLPPRMPVIGPEVLRGIEINPLAAELARTAVWIGDIQWSIKNGLYSRPEPILRSLENIECRDALLNADGTSAEWPKADFIVGNPPFLGASLFLRSFGKSYTDTLRAAYKYKVPATVDLSSYWFEKTANAVLSSGCVRAGLVSTNSIRQSSHRTIMDKIRLCGIFNAWSDLPWVNEGAAVNVSLICFGRSYSVVLDGKPVDNIGSDLTAFRGEESSLQPYPLDDNKGKSFQGSQKIGSFDISGDVARRWLKLGNPNLRPNSDVVKKLWNGIDLTRTRRDMWVVDFGTCMSLAEAEMYEAPFLHVLNFVKPERLKNNREQYRKYWWRHGEPRVAMRKALSRLSRYIAISEKSKHFFFDFVPGEVLPDKRLIVVAKDDYVTFGILSSKIHKIWSKKYGSTLEDRPCYTPSTCFETFPFPKGMSPSDDLTNKISASAGDIAAKAEILYNLRCNWMKSNDHKPRTLTRLYNENPSWLSSAYDALDGAVLAAYGLDRYLDAASVLDALIRLNVERRRQSVGRLSAANTLSTAETLERSVPLP